MMLSITHQLLCVDFHLREREPLLSKIFQRRTDVINCVVNVQETIVYFVQFDDVDGGILGVMALDVERHLRCYVLGVYCS